MDKLIVSEKLIHDLSGIRDALPDIFLKNVMSAAISCVEKQPTVDAVPVVWCRDCKYWIKFDSSLIGEVMCCTGQGFVNILKRPDDFCSCWKERRDGNG